MKKITIALASATLAIICASNLQADGAKKHEGTASKHEQHDSPMVKVKIRNGLKTFSSIYVVVENDGNKVAEDSIKGIRLATAFTLPKDGIKKIYAYMSERSAHDPEDGDKRYVYTLTLTRKHEHQSIELKEDVLVYTCKTKKGHDQKNVDKSTVDSVYEEYVDGKWQAVEK